MLPATTAPSHSRTPALESLERRRLLSAAPHVFAPHSTVRGESLGEYAADWLKWALSIPNSTNPLNDTTGANAGVDQPKNVFFLGGTLPGGPASVTRNITVPTGTDLFFPVLNLFWVNVNTPYPPLGIPADPPFATNEPNIRANFDTEIAAFTGVFATIDGAPVSNLTSHVEEDPFHGFTINFPTTPAENPFFGLPGNILGEAATDGIYLMTGPLTPGQHTIHFGGTDPISNFSLDVTYHITVVPKGQYQLNSNPPGKPASPFNTTTSIADSMLATHKPIL
jgi:hypothetical protein